MFAGCANIFEMVESFSHCSLLFSYTRLDCRSNQQGLKFPISSPKAFKNIFKKRKLPTAQGLILALSSYLGNQSRISTINLRIHSAYIIFSAMTIVLSWEAL